MSFSSRSARSAALPKPSQNRGGVPSSSSSSYIERAPLLRRPLSRKSKNATSAPPPPLLLRTVPRASLWGSLFGGGGNGESEEAREEAAESKPKPKPKLKEEQEEEDHALLDPGSLPPCLPESVHSRTFLAGRAHAVSYTASKDGWSALRFHEKCDFKGPSLVVAETTQ